MAWLSENWILVVIGIVLLVVLLRSTARVRHTDQMPPADARGGANGKHDTGKHQHGGHGCC